MYVVADEFYEAVDSLQIHVNVDSDTRRVDVTDNTAADVDGQNLHDNVEATLVENNRVLQDAGTVIVNIGSDSHCNLSNSHSLPADEVHCLSEDNMSASNSTPQPTDSASAGDNVESQQQNTADNNINADSDNTHSNSKEAVVCDNVSGVEETVDDDFLQSVVSQLPADVNQSEQNDKALPEDSQQTSCTSLPLLAADEPSTADSNDDFAEFVEASTSLNPDSAAELCVDTLPVTNIQTRQLESGTDAEQQLDEDRAADDKYDEQRISLSSAVSITQPGDEFAGNSPSQPSSAGDNIQLQQFDSTAYNEQADNSSTQLQSIQAVESNEVSVVECADNSPSKLTETVSVDDNDNAQLQQHDSTDDIQADSVNTQSEVIEAVVCDSISNNEEAVDDFLQPVGGQLPSDVDLSEQQRKASLPLLAADEPSTADSNDDFAEFVEASTSLNPDSAEEQSETGTDAEQQLDADGDADKEQFVDSSSDMSPQQPVDGRY